MDLPITDVTTPDPGGSWVPVDACTLPTAEQPLRLAEFDDLFAATLREAQARAHRARLVLAGDAALPDRVRRLADAESACCSFFTVTVTVLGSTGAPGQTVVALDIVVPPARTDVLAALVRRAEDARRAAS